MELLISLTISENASHKEIAEDIKAAGEEAAGYVRCCVMAVDEVVYLNNCRTGEATLSRVE